MTDTVLLVEEITKRSAPKTLARFDKLCFEKDGMSEKEWTKAIEHNSIIHAVIEQPGIVAVAVAKFGAGIGYLYSSAVLPEYRRMGFGKRLVETRIAELSLVGCHIVQAHTRIDNHASEAMLISCGFDAIQYVTDYYDDFEDAILWEKRI